MLRVVLNAWVTKTPAAEILANPATRRRQVTMTISLNPLRSASQSAANPRRNAARPRGGGGGEGGRRALAQETRRRADGAVWLSPCAGERRQRGRCAPHASWRACHPYRGRRQADRERRRKWVQPRRLAKALGVGPTTIHFHFEGGVGSVFGAAAQQALAGVTRPYKPKEEPATYLGELLLKILQALHATRVREASRVWAGLPVPLARHGPIYRACCKLRLRDNLGYGLPRWVRLAVGV